MVREIRVKEYKYPTQSFSVATVDTIYSTRPLNGDILQVQIGNNATGSVALSLSGTGEEVFRRNAGSSTGGFISQPRVFSQSTVGSIANAEHVPFIINDVLALNIGSMASGTTHALDVTVRYR